MIKREDLVRYRKVTRWNLGILEKDILQHLVLHALEAVVDHFTFKGGTALQKTFGLPRFSEDLDFTLIKDIKTDQLIELIISDLSHFGHPASWKVLEDNERVISGKLLVEGPLFSGTGQSRSSIKLDISKREEIRLPIIVKEIVPPYTELPIYVINVMDPMEMAAEKIRAIMTRSSPRDLFDLDYIIKRGVDIDLDLVDQKLMYYDLLFDPVLFKDRVMAYSRIWERYLQRLVKRLPDFEDAATRVIAKVIKNETKKYR